VAWILASALQLVTVSFLDRQVQAHAAVERSRTASDFAALTGPMPDESENAWSLYEEAFAQVKDVFAAFDEEQQTKALAELEKAVAERQRLATQPTTHPEGEETDDTWAEQKTLTSEGLLAAENAGKPEMVELLKRLEPAMSLLRQAADRPANRLALATNLPTIFDGLRSYKDIRTAAVIFHVHAIVMARQGKLDAAMQDIRVVHKIAWQIDQSVPSLVAGLVAIGAHGCGYRAMIEALPYAAGTLEVPPDLPADETRFREAFDRNIRGEETLIVASLLAFGDDSLASGKNPGASAKAGLAYRLLWLEADIPTIRALVDSERGRLWGKPARTELYGRGGVPKGSMIVQLFFPSLRRAIEVNGELEANARQVRIAVALTRYRLKHGAYPSDLGALVPEWLPAIPADPFDQKAMRYRLDGRDAIIYSVGRNGKDDGGNIEPAARAGRDDHADHGYRLAGAR